MGVFADKARKALAAQKEEEAAEKGNQEGRRDSDGAPGDTAVDMEGGEEGKPTCAMPNLPGQLSREEKKYLLAVERGDLNTVKKMLQKSARNPGYLNKNCVDPLGRGSLNMSIDNESLEMVELLVVMGVETNDSLLHAINVEFVEAVEVLLEHEEVIHQDGTPYSWENMDMQTASFTPEITPLILAAHRNNYEILKILLDRGAALPMPHDIRCGCDECIQSSTEDSLKHSRTRISAYQALASPSLIALSSSDPILTAFELSDELKRLSYEEQEFSAKYKELRTQCRGFAQELLSHSRSSTELAVILNFDPEAPPYEDGDVMKLRRLELAIDYKQKGFVAHPNVQQLISSLWYAGLPGFNRLGLREKLTLLVQIVFFFPAICLQYMIYPDSESSKKTKTPFMKFLLHSASYLFFLLVLILFSVRFGDQVIMMLGTESMKLDLLESMKKQRGNLPSPLEVVILVYVFGFIWEEICEIKKDGMKKYFLDMWNLLDILRDSMYMSTFFLRCIAFLQQNMEIAQDPQTAFIPREDWHGFDPQLISEGVFAAANVLSALKLVHIFSIHPHLGPLQISLGRMVIDIVKFLIIYMLVLFAFACGMTQLLWYFNDLEKQKCYSLPGGQADWAGNGDACMKWRRFHNLFEASQTLFWAGFGMIGLSDFELEGVGGYTRFWSMLMFGAYSVINIIVLLNLLIAMMSNSYSFIVEHADKEWKFARCKLWMSYFDDRSTLPPPFNIMPTIKAMKKLFAPDERKIMMRKWSSRKMKKAKAARNHRYMSVMRALIWRYVTAMTQSSLDRNVTEDDVNEVKGDISSFRFELIDLFKENGMDTSKCENKSKAAMGRKMRIWERRLMRDFHVSPAMGIADGMDLSVIPDDVGDQFKRIAKLAMISKASSDGPGTVAGGNQIGRRASQGGGLPPAEDEIETLRVSMAKARKKMEEDTPDNSPTSSRGCSPYPGLYSGPNLLSTIKGLDLSPDPSRMNTPLPKSAVGTMKKDAVDKQAKDPGMLTIPGRRAESTLKSKGDENTQDSKNISVTPPQNIEGADDRMKSFINDAAKSVEPKQADRPRELNVSKLIEIDSPQPKSRAVVIDVNSARNAPAPVQKASQQGSKIDDIRTKFASEIPVQPNYGRPRPTASSRPPGPAQFDLKPAPGRPAPGRPEPERENVPMKSVSGGKDFERRDSAGKIPDADDGSDIENVEFVRRKPKGKRHMDA